MDTVALLRQLSEASGVTGYEEEVRALVAEAFRPHADEIASTPSATSLP